jgi:hypothetical protein
MSSVPSPEVTAKKILEAAVAGPLGMRPTHVLKYHTLRQRAMDRGVHIDDFVPGVEYAAKQGWLEPMDGGFFRLTEAGFAAVSSPPPSAQSAVHGQGGSSTADTMTVSSRGQSGGVTASEVHFHGPTNFHGHASTPAPHVAKSPWWKSWWTIASGIAVLLAGLIPLLEYLHIAWPWRHEQVDSQAQLSSAAALQPPAKPAELSQTAPMPQPSAQAIVKAAAEPKPERSHERKSRPSGAPFAVNSVGTVYNNSGIIAPGATGSITQQVQGYVPPPPRVMTDEQLQAAVAKLQTAPPGSIVQLNYAASDDNKEVQHFSAQVEMAFRRADHWKLSTQRIGRSTTTTDGGTLTAEGIGCTTLGDNGGIAVAAMAAAGFPCSRKAADWGVANPPPGDIVISIGSRIIPQE